MTASNKFKLRAFTLLMTVVVVGFASSAMAFCSSCNAGAPAYSAGYAAPVAYQAAYAPAYAAPAYTTAYAPTYNTAYAPVAYTTAYAPAYTTYNSGWYPGRFLGRVNRSIWGQPTTTYYAPTYTAAYAPAYTAGYAPTYTAGYATTAYYAAPACSSCSAGYAPAPACSTCSACSASYAPACSSCSTCDACSGSVSVVEAPCSNCTASAVAPAAYTETVVAPPAASTYGTQSTPSTATQEPTPALPPDANVPGERTLREADKPAPADPLELEPTAEPADDSATNLQAPKLFDPSDRTASRHPAPVWTAVYHKVSGTKAAAQPISWQQAERDAEGWSSAAE